MLPFRSPCRALCMYWSDTHPNTCLWACSLRLLDTLCFAHTSQPPRVLREGYAGTARPSPGGMALAANPGSRGHEVGFLLASVGLELFLRDNWV